MIKINLLDSVTDRVSHGVVEAKVTNPRNRMLMLAVAVGTLLVVGIAFDWFSANSAHAAALAELQRQEQIKVQMEAVNKEQAELEKKIKDIQARIDAIKKLRASQQGPVAVLSAVNGRLPAIADFRLDTIEQKSGELIIDGNSPNEAAVTQFGRSLEFSSGLFSNVNIEIARKPMDVNPADYAGGVDATAPKPETVTFKIKCKYTEPGANLPGTAPAATAVPATRAQPRADASAATTPASQVARN
ncbi:MAG: PilN domain-containing protein [Acidobacteriota bacterium]|nr:PilN domain-containing protein [Acidobacteriota bacterium]